MSHSYRTSQKNMFFAAFLALGPPPTLSDDTFWVDNGDYRRKLLAFVVDYDFTKFKPEKTLKWNEDRIWKYYRRWYVGPLGPRP